MGDHISLRLEGREWLRRVSGPREAEGSEGGQEEVLVTSSDSPSLPAWLDVPSHEPASPLFSHWTLDFCAQFHHAEVALSGPDLSLAEGANVCAQLRAQNSIVCLPQPIVLQGFSVLWGLIQPDRIQTRSGGLVEVSTGSLLNQDITETVLGSPIGRFFPDRRIHPVRWEDLLRPAPPTPHPPPNSSGPDLAPLINALHLMTIRGNVCPSSASMGHGTCANPLASLELYLDIARLRQTLMSRRFENFDFTGILQGTHGELHHFPLSQLPWPAGINVQEGVADLVWYYDATQGVMHVSLTNLSADILDTIHFGTNPVHLEGIVHLSLSRDGMMDITLDKCDFHTTQVIPPSDSSPTLSGSVNGGISMHFDSIFRLPRIQRVTLALLDLHIQTPDQHPLRLSEQISFSGLLEGRAEFQYDIHNTHQPLYADWELTSGNHGIENLWQFGGTRVQTQDVVLRGHGGFHWLEGLAFPIPNLGDFNLLVRGQASLTRAGRPPLSISHLNFAIVGQGRDDQTETADLHMTAASLNIGPFSLVPLLSFRVVEQNEGEHRHLQAEGPVRLSSTSGNFEVASDVSFSTDFQHYQWSAILGDVLRAGLFRAQGRVEVEGHGELHGDSEVVNPRWTIRTSQPVSVYLRNRRVASDVRVSGQGRGLSHDLTVNVRHLLNHGEAMLQVGSSGTRSPVRGGYRLKLGRLFSYEGLTLTDFISQGSFSMPSWTGFLARPEINLTNVVTARTEGEVAGPLSANFSGLLRIIPASSLLSFSFRRDRLSNIAGGPLYVNHSSDYVQGGVRPMGTLNVHMNTGNFSGRSLGVTDGSLYYNRGGQNHPSSRAPLVSHFSFMADRLLGIRRGVAVSGGDGFHYEFSLDQNQLGLGIPENTRPRHISSSIDQLDISTEGFWRLFKDWFIANQRTTHPGGGR